MKPFRSIAVLLLPYLLLFAGMLRAQTFTLRGVVIGEYDKEGISFATIMTGDRKIGTYANISGEYELSLTRVPDTIIFKEHPGNARYLDTMVTGLHALWPRNSSVMDLVMPLRERPPFGPITYITDPKRKKDGRNKVEK
jgi:hypothetical protein